MVRRTALAVPNGPSCVEVPYHPYVFSTQGRSHRASRVYTRRLGVRICEMRLSVPRGKSSLETEYSPGFILRRGEVSGLWRVIRRCLGEKWGRRVLVVPSFCVLSFDLRWGWRIISLLLCFARLVSVFRLQRCFVSSNGHNCSKDTSLTCSFCIPCRIVLVWVCLEPLPFKLFVSEGLLIP